MESAELTRAGVRGAKAKAEKQQPGVVVLSRISAALSGLWDLEAILDVGLDSALDIMNGSIGEILLIDEKSQSLSHIVHRGLSKEFVENVVINLGEGITGSVAQTGKAVLLEDISKDPRVAHRELIIAEGLKALGHEVDAQGFAKDVHGG